MTEWRDIQVRDLVTHVASGPSPTSDERTMRKDEWGLLKTTAVTWEQGWSPEAHKVPPQRFWGNKSLEIRSGDVVITKAGPRHRVGVAAHVDSTPQQLMVSGKMVLLRPDPSKVEPSVFALALATPSAQMYLDQRTTGMAESQVNFSNAALLGCPLRLPPLDKQRRIAEILDTIDESIQTTERLITKLEMLLDGLLRELVEAHFKSGPLKPLGETLAGIIDFRGRTPKKLGLEWGGGDIPALSANNVAMGTIDFSKETYFGSPKLYRRWMTSGDAAKGDVLITMEAPLGNIAQVPDNRKYILSQRVVLLKYSSDQLRPSFARWVMTSQPFQDQLRRRSTGTTATGVRRAELEQIPIPVAPDRLQSQVVNTLGTCEARLDREQAVLDKLRDQRQGLASDLLSGRVRTVAS